MSKKPKAELSAQQEAELEETAANLIGHSARIAAMMSATLK